MYKFNYKLNLYAYKALSTTLGHIGSTRWIFTTTVTILHCGAAVSRSVGVVAAEGQDQGRKQLLGILPTAQFVDALLN